MALKLTKFEASEYLASEDEMIAYLEACLEEGDIELFKLALGDVAKAKGMSKVSAASGVGRQGIYKALTGKGNPAFETIVSVMKPLGLRLSVEKIPADQACHA